MIKIVIPALFYPLLVANRNAENPADPRCFLLLFVTGLPLVLQALPGLRVGVLVLGGRVCVGLFFFPLSVLFLFLKTSADP